MSNAQGNAPEGPAGPGRRHRRAIYGVPPSGAAPHGHWPHWPPWPLPHHHNPYGTPAPGMPAYGGPLEDGERRPATVLAAAIVTMITSGLMLLFLGVVSFLLVAARSDIMAWVGDRIGASASDVDIWFPAIVVAVVLLFLWCLAAVLLAVLALHRSNAARIMLVISSAVTAVLSLVAIASGVSLVFLVAAVAVIVCLFAGGAGDWFRREHLFSPPQLPKL